MMNNLLKMNEATDGTQGGGSGGGTGNSSFLATSQGGGGAQASAPNAGAPQGTGEQKAPGNASSGGATQGSTTSDWRSQLPEELQKDASISKFDSPATLAKSYLNAQRLLGADKIPVPGKNATAEDWKNVYHKLGLPESKDKYAVKFKEGISLNEEFANTFKEQAYNAGVLPQQAQAMADWFSDINLKAEQTIAEEKQKQFKADQEVLAKEWGQGYNTKIARAMKVLEDHGGKELIDHLNATGMGADGKVVKFLAALGDKLYAEHKIVNESGALTTGKTPDEIRREINRMMADPAYMNKSHPNHKQAVKDMQDLYAELHPKK